MMREKNYIEFHEQANGPGYKNGSISGKREKKIENFLITIPVLVQTGSKRRRWNLMWLWKPINLCTATNVFQFHKCRDFNESVVKRKSEKIYQKEMSVNLERSNTWFNINFFSCTNISTLRHLDFYLIRFSHYLFRSMFLFQRIHLTNMENHFFLSHLLMLLLLSI